MSDYQNRLGAYSTNQAVQTIGSTANNISNLVKYLSCF